MIAVRQSLVNHGTIAASSGVLNMPIPLTNYGLLRSTPTGTLNLIGQWSAAGGTLDCGGGTIQILYRFDNAGHTFAINGPASTLVASNIGGGTIVTTNGGGGVVLRTGQTTPYLDGVYVDADVYVPAFQDALLDHGTTLAPGRRLHLAGDQNHAHLGSGFSGEVVFDAGATTSSTITGVVDETFGPGVTVRTAGGSGDVSGSGGPSLPVEIYGLFSAETSGCTLGIHGFGQAVNNHGTLNVSAGTLLVAPGMNNTGTVQITGGTCSLNTILSNAGTISMSGGTLNLGGTVDLTKLGTFVRSGGAVNLAGTLLNANSTADFTSAVGPWALVDGATIKGGSVVPSAAGQSIQIPGGATVTLDGASLDADATLAAGSTLRFFGFAGKWSQRGTITGNGATLSLGGNFALADVGSLNLTNSTVLVTGALNNTGATLPLSLGQNTPLMLDGGGAIVGGTVGHAGEALSVRSGRLNGVQLPVVVNVLNQLNVDNGLTLSGGSVDLIAGAALIVSGSGPQLLGGTGEVVLDGAGSAVSAESANGTLLIGPGVTVRTGTQGGRIAAASFNTVVQGTVSSRTSGRGISLSGNVTNQGTIEARNGGTISLTPASLANFSGGTLTGGTWAVYGASTMTLGTSTIATNKAAITLDGAASTFAAADRLVTNLGTFTVTNGRRFTTRGALTNAGTIVVGPQGVLTVKQSLDNAGGTIDLNSGLVIDYAASGTSPRDAIVGQFGTHIVSSQAAVNAGERIGYAEAASVFHAFPATFLGTSVDSSSLLLRLTLAGDSDLSGNVDLTDFTYLAASFNKAGGAQWLEGDYNYDGTVDLTDFTFLAANFNQTLPDTGARSLGATVPEPGSLSTLAAAAAALTASRRRGCRGGRL